ncbi:MAG: glycosyltransferase [Proteobacteria bacterium]|jgi:glycosyltransferase involved in cell wall biosynthesis|nr:glycosyltransferase [Alphaproteobacteria bacterium]NCC04027.1 glycosyltransferase [Pseudomonadota bacterium]
MRILQIMAGRGQGGAETYSVDVMLSLHAAGVDQCVVVAPDAPRTVELIAAGLRVNTDVLRSRFRFIRRWRLAQLIATEKPDLIHCWMRRAASLIPSWKDGPVIGWFGGYYDPANFKRCTQFVGVTQGIVDHMRQKGVPAEHSHYVPTFPDVRDEAPVDRTTLDTPHGAPVVLALSRLHPKKGLDTLLKAAAQIEGLYVWLAGEGPLRQELEKLTRKLGLTERVRFLGWRTDRGALLRSADICALPSRYEPFGTVILEAWAAGTPFVAAMSAGPAAHVLDGENGLLVPIDDVDALTSALRRVIEDEPLRRRIIVNGFDTYSRTYTRKAVTERIIALYQRMIASFSGRSAV